MPARRHFLTRILIAATAVGLAGSTSAADPDWAARMFEKTEHDFGDVARGSDANYRLKLKNLYQQDVHIHEVRTTCGCSAGKPSQETLKSLEEAYVEITMDTRKFLRRKDSNVIVVFDRPLYQEVRIPITAYIRPDVVVEPGSVQFGTLEYEQSAARTLKVAYAGRENWTITAIKTDSEFVSATAVETSRGNGLVNYDIEVKLSEAAPIGTVRQTITLVTDDEKNPNVPILVEGVVRPDIVVNPTIVSLGTLSPGQQRTFNVVLRGTKPFMVESVTCEKLTDVFAVRLPKAEAPVQIIPLTVTAPSNEGTLDEELQVAIPGRREPVVFRAYGKIAIAGNNDAPAVE